MECTPKDLVYMDPPYQGVCGNRDQRYLPTISHAEFCDALERLNDRGIMFAVSYDGRTGDKVYGERLPDRLNLLHLEIRAGRSTQSTLLGRNDVTYEGFYVSPSLASHIHASPTSPSNQLVLW
jgi:DNA adenine methylase